MVAVSVVSLCRINSCNGSLLTTTQTGHQYLDNLQLMIQFMPKKLISHQSWDFSTTLLVSTFLIMSVHYYCIDRYAHTAYIHTLKHTHSLFQGIMRHYVYLHQSSLPSSLRSLWFNVPARQSRCSR